MGKEGEPNRRDTELLVQSNMEHTLGAFSPESDG